MKYGYRYIKRLTYESIKPRFFINIYPGQQDALVNDVSLIYIYNMIVSFDMWILKPLVDGTKIKEIVALDHHLTSIF